MRSSYMQRFSARHLLQVGSWIGNARVNRSTTVKGIGLGVAWPYLLDTVLFVEVGNSRAAMEEKYDFLPMTWIDLEYGGDGVCCIQGVDLTQQKDRVSSIAGDSNRHLMNKV